MKKDSVKSKQLLRLNGGKRLAPTISTRQVKVARKLMSGKPVVKRRTVLHKISRQSLEAPSE